MLFIGFFYFKNIKKKSNSNINYEEFEEIGIDDFAFKKRLSYGTVFIDHKSNKIINIIDSRLQEDVTNELTNYINLKKCSRDGSTLYKGAITAANKNIIQISDRFHLIKNCIDAIKDDLKKLSDKNIDLCNKKYDLSWIKIELSPEQKSIFARRNKKQELIEKVRYDYNVIHINKKGLIEKYCLDDKTVTRYLRKDATIPRRNNKTKLHKYSEEIYKKLLEYKTQNTDINYRAIHTYICSLGYDESYENFYKQLKLRIVEDDLYDSTTINRKEFHKLLYGAPISDLKLDRKIEQLLIEYLQNDNNHSRALNIISSFKEIITNNSTTLLNDYLNIFNLPEWNDWIKVKEFMKGVERDIIAVNNQINEKITNSTTEGFVSKIKTIKKRTYGRASFSHLKSLILLS